MQFPSQIDVRVFFGWLVCWMIFVIVFKMMEYSFIPSNSRSPLKKKCPTFLHLLQNRLNGAGCSHGSTGPAFQFPFLIFLYQMHQNLCWNIPLCYPLFIYSDTVLDHLEMILWYSTNNGKLNMFLILNSSLLGLMHCNNDSLTGCELECDGWRSSRWKLP